MKPIKGIALDVDGVLTDGTFTWGVDGGEYKSFSFTDIMGISIAKKAGIVFAIISGENTPHIDYYANKMGITDVFKGCKDKASALRKYAIANGLELSEVCFMGDDVNDLSAMELAGFSAAPDNAHEKVKLEVDYVTKKGGGNGAVRELIDLLINSDS